MNAAARLDHALRACPLIAILRGIAPDEVLEVGQVLMDCGFQIIEVPLNSPDPFVSIARLVEAFGHCAVIGAGTVTSVHEVAELQRIGGAAVISPHCDLAVIRATVDAGMVSLPGVLSPTEAFSALAAGAHGLKLFPMEMIGVKGIKALRAVLPPSTRLIAVGGVDGETIPALQTAGCVGFGVGSSLYRQGHSASAIRSNATALLASLTKG